ncbi:MAG: hypothetical protein IK093_11795 [Ruminiclostridium sp.]|nr:hypothetical protein [Ruminiclostridium sp.]
MGGIVSFAFTPGSARLDSIVSGENSVDIKIVKGLIPDEKTDFGHISSVLLYGVRGSCKTGIAFALAGEMHDAGYECFCISAAVLMNRKSGYLRKLFAQAHERAVSTGKNHALIIIRRLELISDNSAMMYALSDCAEMYSGTLSCCAVMSSDTGAGIPRIIASTFHVCRLSPPDTARLSEIYRTMFGRASEDPAVPEIDVDTDKLAERTSAYGYDLAVKFAQFILRLMMSEAHDENEVLTVDGDTANEIADAFEQSFEYFSEAYEPPKPELKAVRSEGYVPVAALPVSAQPAPDETDDESGNYDNSDDDDYSDFEMPKPLDELLKDK